MGAQKKHLFLFASFVLLALLVTSKAYPNLPFWVDAPSRPNTCDPRSPNYRKGPNYTFTPVIIVTPTPVLSPTITSTYSASPTVTPTSTISPTFSITPTSTESPVFTDTQVFSQTATPTQTPIATSTLVDTFSDTATVSPSPTGSPTQPLGTLTPTSAMTATASPTPHSGSGLNVYVRDQVGAPLANALVMLNTDITGAVYTDSGGWANFPSAALPCDIHVFSPGPRARRFTPPRSTPSTVTAPAPWWSTTSRPWA